MTFSIEVDVTAAASSLELTLDHVGETILARLAGEIDPRAAQALSGRLEQLAEQDTRGRLVIDLDHVYLSDTASVAALAAALHAANLATGPVRVVGSRAGVREAIRRAGLDRLHTPDPYGDSQAITALTASRAQGSRPWPG
jgi:anti-anti-sigma factor